MTDTQQPEALLIAATLEAFDMDGAADAVRRLHAAHQHTNGNVALLADILNRRPAMNAGLVEAYAAWTAEVYNLMGAMAAAPANDADPAMSAAQPDLNLNCKSTQKRLATLWGFVPAGAQQPGYEHQRAIMEAERNASLDEYSRIVPLTSTESMIYERAFTNGWNRRASHGQAPAQAAPVALAGPLNELEELNLLNKLIALGAKAAQEHAQSNSDDGHKGTAAYVQWQELRAEMGELIRNAYAAPTAQPAPQQEAQEPVMIYHGDCTIDCGEHGHHHVELLRMIPAGSKLYTAPQPSPAAQEGK